ncbi:MAG: tRNA dihydrouridine synthase DusB [Oscillospiraceae bacterium]|nr:tRNA dihydrouridine synthase DusB [Oscillospiraceae bacterium]
MQIGTVNIESKLVLAPMAGVTDQAFRTVCRRLGAGYTYTEMISSKALTFHDGKTRSLMALGPGESPAAVQIFGSDPVCMGEAAAIARDLCPAEILDINMGCPVGKIAGSGDGSALMRDPDKAARIVEACVKAAGKPVTVKIRKGWDMGSVNAPEFARTMEAAGASAIAVHGRTRTQMYAGKADWDIIRQVKEAVTVPVMANGDVFSAEDAVKLLKITGADAVMIGRGALGDPWLFRRAAAALAGDPIPEDPPMWDKLDVAMEQITLAAEFRTERVACLEARRHLSWYLHGFPGVSRYRETVTHLETLEDMRKVIRYMQLDLKQRSEEGGRFR